MPIDSVHCATILQFWRSVETFTLPDMPAPKKGDQVSLLRPGMPLPWEPGRLPAPKEGKQWHHTLCFHVVAKEKVTGLLARLTDSQEFSEPVTGYTCLSALTLDHPGRPSFRTYSPAAFAYGIKALREKYDPEILHDWLRSAQKDYLVRFGLVIPAPPDFEPTTPPTVTWTSLNRELDHLRRLASDQLPTSTPIRCISEQVALSAIPDAPFLNSYYLHDLDTLIRHPHDIGRPLETFLSPRAPAQNRIHLIEPKVLLHHIQHPPPPGRWPSDPGNGLYTAQHAALKIALPHMDPHPSLHMDPHPSLVGINGPPGTGKTTLLREIIAAIIVNRARRLLTAAPTHLFQPRRYQLSDRSGYYRPEPSIIGSDGIVVSGNNNAAIENISHQLPLAKNIHLPSFADAQYFSAFATNIVGEPCWGLISAALGRAKNRSNFIDKFWFNNGKGFGKWLRQQYEDEHLALTNAEQLKSTASRLQSLMSEYDAAVARAPSPNFDHLSLEDLHRATPWSNEYLNTLRSNIFLQSLQLHEWTIRLNARYFYHNLGSFVDMLNGKWRENINEDIATQLWNTFFFCIPVVSVTLASFQRQFHQLGRGSIGWLLLDEAGQASPPSVCGALWRCRRAILIGDTRQIPPVVTIPVALGRLLQDKFGIHDDDWSPSKHSAQYLADRVTTSGAYIQQHNHEPVWTGVPLRAHRRCQEPMFSIANAIAYNGQMVQATLPARDSTPAGTADFSPTLNTLPVHPPIPTGPSGWIDVRGQEPLHGHVIAEEFQHIEYLLQQLTRYPNPIFIISPFRSIADACRQRYETPLVKCGTIHTFQGKETDIVILVLGTQPQSIAARKWVAAGPNILNVAITRAKLRLYIIGNRPLWSSLPYFDTLARQLPVKPAGLLF